MHSESEKKQTPAQFVRERYPKAVCFSEYGGPCVYFAQVWPDSKVGSKPLATGKDTASAWRRAAKKIKEQEKAAKCPST